MGTNALIDTSWIQLSVPDKSCSDTSHADEKSPTPRVRRSATPRDALLMAHESGVDLDLSLPAYALSAQYRFLASLIPSILRECEPDDTMRRRHNPAPHLLRHGLPEDAVDRGLATLQRGANLFDATQPFMQRPPVPPSGPKDTARALGPGQQPVKKLSPAMPSDAGEDFWHLSVAQPGRLPVEEATLALVIYHYFSMAGNNAYDGDKCAMGAPGFRYPGKGFAATEIFWRGDSLLKTLLFSVPRTWVEGTGLPAWADRTGALSTNPSEGTEHPLWRATWSSNTVAAAWEGTDLVGARTGGIPEEWYVPSMGQDKQSRKNWWDQRNTEDPFYLYLPNQNGELKAQRLDFGRDAVDLAVEWVAEGKVEAAAASASDRLDLPERITPSFARHQVEGTASSPSIRASQIFEPSEDQWTFGFDDETQIAVIGHAGLIRQLHGIVCAPFRRRNAGDAKREAQGHGAVVFDNLEARRGDASTAFWRHITPVYEEFIREGSGEQHFIPDATVLKAQQACMAAFDEILAPHREQMPGRAAFVRSRIQRRVLWTIRTFIGNDDETDDPHEMEREER
ncbi:type I-E CRISPR-associated protein Cse1/CasA [Rothia halotolerans]|uniref:type I-E CRISPR-associated protein Cse1/CasA n=1 Tax=Rothia halotolerans TaxID=405770 RepID=UPI00101C75D5|nr:type I-E CRISPR-associated protein Cse1/CasA [Rothia halotolerans]